MRIAAVQRKRVWRSDDVRTMRSPVRLRLGTDQRGTPMLHSTCILTHIGLFFGFSVRPRGRVRCHLRISDKPCRL